MKKLLVLIIALSTFLGCFAQNKSNIKKVMDRVKQTEKLPFYRAKTDTYATVIKTEQGEYKRVNTFDGVMSVDPFGLPFYGYLDFGNTEEVYNKKYNRKPFPTVFRSNKKFKLSNDNYYLIPFLVNYVSEYNEDMLTSCNSNGDVLDVLFVGQAGSTGIMDKEAEIAGYAENIYIFIRQWSINKNEEITVYQLIPTFTGKVYFNNAPSIVNLKRIDTTYKVDENGKFREIAKKEYKPKDYKREELYTNAKNIWEGNEIPID